MRKFRSTDTFTPCFFAATSAFSVSSAALSDTAGVVPVNLRKYNVSTKHIAKCGERLGIYYLESGSAMRPSKVVYDRAHSSISTATEADFDFDAIFEGADWFHFTGILIELLGVSGVDTCRPTVVGSGMAHPQGGNAVLKIVVRHHLLKDGLVARQLQIAAGHIGLARRHWSTVWQHPR